MNRDKFYKKIFVVPHILSNMWWDKYINVQKIIDIRNVFIENQGLYVYEKWNWFIVYIDIEKSMIMKTYKHIVVEYKPCSAKELTRMKYKYLY